MPRPTGMPHAPRRRRLRLALIILIAIVSIPFVIIATLAAASSDRRR